MTTKLELLNRVLLEVGERTVAASQETSASRKVLGMLYSALTFVNLELPWVELEQHDVLSELDVVESFNGLVGYVVPGNPQYIKSLFHTNSHPVMFADWTDICYKTPYTAVITEFWSHCAGVVYTYPVIVAANRDDYVVSYNRAVVVPDDDDDNVDAPEYLIELYVKHLLYQFSQRHLNNKDLATSVLQEYLLDLYRLSSTYKVQPRSIRTSMGGHTNPSFGLVGGSNE